MPVVRPTAGDARDARIGQIVSEFLDRRARGEAESEAELLAKYPDVTDELRLHLQMLGDLQGSRDALESLLAQGLLRSSPDPRYPAQLGAYKVVDFIGRGGMGVVLKAYEESLNRSVALKLLRPELAADQPALTRFSREARTAASLNHPNIVTVYAVGEERGAHFIAMEYVDGPTLSDVIRARWTTTEDSRVMTDASVTRTWASGYPTRHSRPAIGPDEPAESLLSFLSTAIVRNIFCQLLSGLAAAHAAGIIHRDIKPSNILLHGLGSQSSVLIKVADFGLARMVSGQTRVTLPASVLGTPEYMSPEQARGEEGIDHCTDLYTAGVVLYEMLTGRTPFRADTPSAVAIFSCNSTICSKVAFSSWVNCRTPCSPTKPPTKPIAARWAFPRTSPKRPNSCAPPFALVPALSVSSPSSFSESATRSTCWAAASPPVTLIF